MPYKEGSKWRAQVIQNGKKLTRVFLTKKEAIQWEVSIKHNEPCQPADQKTDTISLLEWTNQYLDFAKAKYVDKVYKEKVFVFRLFFENISPQKPASFLTHKQVLDHLSKQASSRSGYAANKDRKNLVAAWNWGIKYLGLPNMNPFLVDRFPEKRSPRHVPAERDFWTVYEQAESDQDRILLLAFLHLGARKKELFNLHRSDVDFAQSRIRLYTRKRRDGSLEFDWLPMTEHLFTALLGHLNSMENEWVFPNPETGIPYSDRNKWMHRLCGKGGVKYFGLHSIRHLTASILEKENIPLSHIQRILRHKKLTTTERYIHRLSSLRTSLTLLPIPKGTPEKTPLNPIKKIQGLRQVA